MSFLTFCKAEHIIRCGGRGAHLVDVSLQWGFHSSWISAGQSSCWTTHATSTWTRTRASRSECGRSFAASSFVHWSASVLESEAGGRAGQHWGQVTLQRRGRPLKDVWDAVCLSRLIFVSQAYAPRQPMGGGRREKTWVVSGDPERRQSCYYLSPRQPRDQVGWEQHRGRWIDAKKLQCVSEAQGLIQRHNAL